MRHAGYNPANLQDNIRALISGQCDIIQITTPATSLRDMLIQHGLGRVPKGFSVIAGDSGGGGTSSYTPAGTIGEITPTGTIGAITPAGTINAGASANNQTVHSRSLITAVGNFPSSPGGYMSMVTGTAYSSGAYFKAPRSGSVTMLCMATQCSYIGAGDTVLTGSVIKNGAILVSVTGPMLTAIGDNTVESTFTSSNTFSAGDALAFWGSSAYTSTMASSTSFLWAELTYVETVNVNTYAPTFSGTPVTPAFTGTAATPIFTGTPGTVNITTGAVAGATPWDSNIICLKFVATNTPLTLAIW